MSSPAAAALYEEAFGQGEILLCLHGWGLNLRVFDTLAKALSGRRRVLAWDLPGHGRSSWDGQRASFDAQTRQLLAALPPRCCLLGWSLGGQFALELAARAPERIEKLVLLATTPRFEVATDWSAGLEAAVVEGFAAQLARDPRQCVRDFLELQVRGSADAAAVSERLAQALLAHGEADPRALAAGLAILRDNDLRARLASVRAPTLIIAGQYDRVTPPAASEFLAEGVQGARLLQLQRAGHAPFLSHGAEVATAIEGFLA